jgi:hypothetical protein
MTVPADLASIHLPRVVPAGTPITWQYTGYSPSLHESVATVTVRVPPLPRISAPLPGRSLFMINRSSLILTKRRAVSRPTVDLTKRIERGSFRKLGIRPLSTASSSPWVPGKFAYGTAFPLSFQLKAEQRALNRRLSIHRASPVFPSCGPNAESRCRIAAIREPARSSPRSSVLCSSGRRQKHIFTRCGVGVPPVLLTWGALGATADRRPSRNSVSRSSTPHPVP